MIILFDTETTGLPQKLLPASHANQARIVQLAALLVDNELNEIAGFRTLIKPDGWTRIDPRAQEAHGISIEDCQKRGVGGKTALAMYSELAEKSDVAVAHNIAFDKQLISIETEYHKMNNPLIAMQSQFCTMLHSTNVCKLWGKIPGQFKWPKLKEAYKHFYGCEPEMQHDAFGDIKATLAVLRKLDALGIFRPALA